VLIQITAPHFCAGVVVAPNGVGRSAAPILRYMVGWTFPQIVQYCTKKRWHVRIIDDKESPVQH
jgi:hypothetical protein